MRLIFVVVTILCCLCFSGCVQSEVLLGTTEYRQEKIYAAISPSTVPENPGRYDNYVGSPVSLVTTGMTVEIGSTQEPIHIADFKADYEYQGTKMGALKVPFTCTDGPVFRAYLVPEATLLPLAGDTRPMKKGKYRVTLTFTQEGQQRTVTFSFDYQHTSKVYHGPVIMPWQN